MLSTVMKPSIRPKTVTILGSTGSIGRNTLDLIQSQPADFEVVVLTAQKNVELLVTQARQFKAQYAVIGDLSLYEKLKEGLAGTDTKPMAGDQAIVDAAGIPCDWTMAAIVGAAGVRSTIAALRNSKTVALANKESLVCAGSFMMDAAKKYGSNLLPVDSEHNAVFQVFNPSQKLSIRRIILTASGGPFLNLRRNQLAEITPEQAVKHPVWSMGSKISIDSATMMNKALEIIEAHYLFNLKSEQIDAVIHPQSIIHSMVEYLDGSILAQMGAPDMRTPIAHTLAWPDRMQTTGSILDLTKNINLNLNSIDIKRFPSIGMAKDVIQQGQGYPAAFNAANEIAVDAFVRKELKFSEIESVVEKTLEKINIPSVSTIEEVFAVDHEARMLASQITQTE